MWSFGGGKDCALANWWKTNRNHISWKVFFVRAGHLLILEAHMSSCWLINRDICWLFALTELPSGVMKSIRDWVTQLSMNVHSNHTQNAKHLSHVVVVNAPQILHFLVFMFPLSSNLCTQPGERWAKHGENTLFKTIEGFFFWWSRIGDLRSLALWIALRWASLRVLSNTGWHDSFQLHVGVNSGY